MTDLIEVVDAGVQFLDIKREQFDGLVTDGDVYTLAAVRHEYAICHCTDHQHRDLHWRTDKACLRARMTDLVRAGCRTAHIAHRLTAHTTAEEEP